ncbi:asparagine synthase (glutamine-hydrolyzing) [Granulosicoccus antarcticus]|uniref:asparagine synthase (glutamine-hydrolyzing) n=1 Tax=Granulosicoccus antarcticus IMCC3135 TaxID=1192854 RepID=A0A2Z2NSL8_9GAMM|nr:asparagine synthase (glutamine-hydrolyzing) [Granulosicoccus antarcticus]ASJ74502.1 Asparagine synthetase [glutamine-hydrolyzing] 1 [Granulosicoccus antarcticus IMCC3135]
MCGFSGILSPAGGDFTPLLKPMGDAISHRGPDSSGIWVDEQAGFGFVHRRLAIVDISEAGHQPMSARSDRYVISFNGEIYNHLSLRQELEQVAGAIAWQGHSDTETLLMAIDTWGLRRTVDKLVGMFAFALWDVREKTLRLCRDRIGEKPLYYGWHNKRFLFGSELKALAAMPGFDAQIDRDALTLYFRHNYVPAPYSIYEGIKKLEPGCLLTVSADCQSPVIDRYWSAPATAMESRKDPFTGSFSEASAQVEALLSESISGQVVADVPVGAFLSGGIDSSTVVALMQQQSNSRVNTFTIGFDDERFNEAHHAKNVASALGTHHTELYLSDADIAQLVQNMPQITDEPFADSSMLPTYAVSRLARENVTVSLSGDGGDELFGGYTRYPSAASIIRLRRKLGTVGKTAAKTLLSSPLLASSITGQRHWASAKLQAIPGASKAALAIQVLGVDTDALAYRELVSYWRNPHTPVLNAPDPTGLFHDPARWLDTVGPQEAVQMIDVQTYLPDDIMAKVDRASMSVSLETRIPLLDHRLLTFIWSLPPAFRAESAANSLKPLLKDIACRYVPRECIERPKMGFGIPIDAWLRGPLRDWAEELLNPETLQEQGLLDAELVTRHWQNLLSDNSASAEFIWSVLMLQHWMANRSA